jgi:hypothetical protein
MTTQSFGGRALHVTTAAPSHRPVGYLLALGILVAPYIFGWFVLRAGYSTLARTFAFGWCLVVLIAAFSANSGKHPASFVGNVASPHAASSGSGGHSTGVPVSTQSVPTPAQAWQYTETKDQMRGIVTSYATVQSTNQLDFAFPYSGGSTATLILSREEGELNVILTIDKGQFTCFDNSGDKVAMRFDDGLVYTYGCTRSADVRTDIIFLSPEHQILNQLRKAKRVIVEAQFFQAGRHQLTFDIADLKW